jgi:uncharacterized membrane protein YkvA (DUF1232 family)
VSGWAAVALGIGITLVAYATFVLALVLLGRREAARAVATLVPDCVVLFRRLLGDPRVSTRHKLVLAALVPYLVLPFDLVPDFVPVAGYLDDSVLVALVLGFVLRRSGPALVEEHWPGPPASLRLLVRIAGSGARRLA